MISMRAFCNARSGFHMEKTTFRQVVITHVTVAKSMIARAKTPDFFS